jgi:hypothetical protein
LVGRVWGDKVGPEGSRENTVIALMLLQGNKEIKIPCEDINFIK